MIANCSMMVTLSSSVVFPAVAMGKPVVSNLDMREIRSLLPIQNGGTSAERIASICKELMNTPKIELVRTRNVRRPALNWHVQDAH